MIGRKVHTRVCNLPFLHALLIVLVVPPAEIAPFGYHMRDNETYVTPKSHLPTGRRACIRHSHPPSLSCISQSAVSHWHCDR